MIRLSIIAALLSVNSVYAKDLKLIQRSQESLDYKVELVKSETLKKKMLSSSTFKIIDSKALRNGEDLVLVSILGQKDKSSLTYGSVVETESKDHSKVLSVGYQVDIESRDIKLNRPLVKAGSSVSELDSELNDYKKDVRGYVLYVEDDVLAERLGKKGVDLTTKGLRFSLNNKNEFETVQVCEKSKCDRLIVFDLVDLDKTSGDRLNSKEKIALNVNDNELFSSVTAIEEKAIVEEILHNHQGQNERAHQERNFTPGISTSLITGSSQMTEGAKAGSIEDVVCSSSGKAVILGSDLKTVVAEAQTGERLKLVQTFTGNGAPEGFLSVALNNQAQGLILESQISPKSSCEFISKDTNQSDAELRSSVAQASSAADRLEESSALTSAGSKKFPTIKRPTDSYRTGARAFGAGRGRGRSHAACDLYRARNEKTVAVEPGRVIQGPYFFYQGTYAKEVKLNSGPVIRYGEITSKNSGAAKGNFKTGDVIGYIGKTHCCTPMLHFEKYSGAKKGSLSGGGKYRRRSDLQNPTSYLQGLEKATFGKSY